MGGVGGMGVKMLLGRAADAPLPLCPGMARGVARGVAAGRRLSTPSWPTPLPPLQKPGVLRVPLVKLFLDTWAETVELVRPVFRFGIPESSLRDKCPYWR